MSNEFSEYSINAYHKSKMEALRASGIDSLEKLTVQQIVNIITNYSELGDLYRISNKYNLTIGAVKSLLQKYDIKNQIDAIKLVRAGLVADFKKEQVEEVIEEAIESAREQKRKEKLLEEEDKKREKEPPQQTLEQDKEDSELFNKKVKAKQAVEDLLKLKQQKFRIPPGEALLFKQMLPHGLGALIRHFGGTKEEILNEIKRLVPSFDVSVLRP